MTWAPVYWRAERVQLGPSEIGQAALNRAVRQAGALSCFGQAHLLTQIGYESGIFSVATLLCLRRPPAVFWFISFATVNAIKRVLGRWPIAYVSEKGRKIMTPSIAHYDANCPVEAIGVVSGVVASLFHLAPRAIERMLAIGRRGVPVHLAGEHASARLWAARQQVDGAGDLVCATIAPAPPPPSTKTEAVLVSPVNFHPPPELRTVRGNLTTEYGPTVEVSITEVNEGDPVVARSVDGVVPTTRL